MFWNENPKLTESGLINFSKIRAITDLIQLLREWQLHLYHLPTNVGPIPDQIVQYCHNLRAIKDAAIYKYSCLCETKNGAESNRLLDKWTANEKKGKKLIP
jgi:hypothetical protein